MTILLHKCNNYFARTFKYKNIQIINSLLALDSTTNFFSSKQKFH